MLCEDIRFIRLNNPRLHTQRDPLLFSGLYFGLLAVILAAFVGTYIALRKQIRDSQNAALIRGRRANKVAIQRFRAAKSYMEQQNQHAFYEEMLRALWGYMSDKSTPGGQPDQGECPGGALQAGRLIRGGSTLLRADHPL